MNLPTTDVLLKNLKPFSTFDYFIKRSKQMQDYEERVIEEKKLLDVKIKDLDQYLAEIGGIDEITIELLELQRNHMFQYSILLGARIQRWTMKND